MAIIDNKVPSVDVSNLSLNNRIVIKFRPNIKLPYSIIPSDLISQHVGSAWTELSSHFDDLNLVPFFKTVTEDLLSKFVFDDLLSSKGVNQKPFLQYYCIDFPIGKVAEEIANKLRSWHEIEIAYVEGYPIPPLVNYTNNPHSSNQGYLEKAPKGIDAHSAWEITSGEGTKFVDLEQGWTLNHQDLVTANIQIISGINYRFHGHGTAVLGIVSAADNKLGGVGIAPATKTEVASQCLQPSQRLQPAGRYLNTAEAILSVIPSMNAGDVLLLEAQIFRPSAGGYVPIEVEDAVFDAIKMATSRGIVVIEPAANGSIDLDKFKNEYGKNILNRASQDFRDSGAIMVGAASSSVPHSRLAFSNYGSRIDCFSWGEHVSTCGKGWQDTETTTYTNDFGGTSAASPIIAGAALLMQSWAIKTGRGLFNPATLRNALSDTSLNTLSASPKNDRIGAMPNLKALIK